jgi:hypothetical protein
MPRVRCQRLPQLVMQSNAKRYNLQMRIANRNVWPGEDPFGGAGETSDGFVDVCLVTALRSLGVPVPYTGSGPFRALRDGNNMLSPFGFKLIPVKSGVFRDHDCLAIAPLELQADVCPMFKTHQVCANRLIIWFALCFSASAVGT